MIYHFKPMQSVFQKHLKTAFPFLEGKRLLVACSGGLDSVVLTYLLAKSGYDITLVHCNFSLRGNESDSDSKFVIQLAKQLQLPVYTEVFETEAYANERGISTQMAARELRYRWFDELSKQLGLDYILTAHHLDDSLETTLINFSRGTGLRGLTGIPALSGKLVRPLLVFSREMILNYAEKNKLSWREDSSNAINKYLRNSLRNEVIPKWKENVPALLKNFETTRQHLESSRELVEDYLALLFHYLAEETPSGYRFSVQKLKTLPHSNLVLYELFSPLGFLEIDDLQQLLSAQTGKKLYSSTHILLKDRSFLILEVIPKTPAGPYSIAKHTNEIFEPLPLQFEHVSELGESSENVIFVDLDLLQYPLILRKWNEGDAFYPFGMTGKKKISKFFKDEKLSLLEKQKVWLLCTSDRIMWVVGLRADNRFKVSNKTKQILKIQLQK